MKWPTERLRRGLLGEPFFVLSISEIRNGEILEKKETFQTADGDVIGRPGDVAITAYGGERYPILRSVFFGAYQVLGRIGKRMIARRLVHVRVAWEVTSPDAEFDYGPDRGVASVERGGWIYSSDDNDFGTINNAVKHRGHVTVGPVADVVAVHWWRRLEWVGAILTFLPAVLTLLALLSLQVSLEVPPREALAGLLTIVEATILACGIGCALWMERNNWRLKASVSAGASIARKFQVAVKMLGWTVSEDFPQMALWRAGQDIPFQQSPAAANADAGDLAALRAQLAEAASEIEAQLKRNSELERVGEAGQILAVILVLVINLCMILGSHWAPLELASIWLPSVLGSLHSLTHRKRSADRMATLREYLEQLRFVKVQLQAQSAASESSELISPEQVAVLQLLCRATGEYCQEELRIALAQRPTLPA